MIPGLRLSHLALRLAENGGLQAEVQRPRPLVREVRLGAAVVAHETIVSAGRWRHLCVAEAEVLRIVRGERGEGEQRAQGQSQGGVG